LRGSSGFTHKGERIVSQQNRAFNDAEKPQDFHEIPDESEFLLN